MDGTVRYLRNTGGLWLLQECLREWDAEGSAPELADLLAAAAELPPDGPVIDAGSTDFLAPADMPARIGRAVEATGHPAPPSRAALVRCILDSLADAYARTLQDAVRLSGQSIDVVHVVGGGSQNELLCRLTAERTGLPVVAGPVEATALGNILVQARSAGRLPSSGPGLAGIRAAARAPTRTGRAEPTSRGATTSAHRP
ncbi:FGGY-family carbohydrate kinase [Arthrobacter sp. RIT-PI-e]|uniref:FGGY-family carbohydrate kinase n=1 Tax=Arthrobacter sp. RIT-PI-e TaxID=1681197 RepID=UPI0006765C03